MFTLIFILHQIYKKYISYISKEELFKHINILNNKAQKKMFDYYKFYV